MMSRLSPEHDGGTDIKEDATAATAASSNQTVSPHATPAMPGRSLLTPPPSTAQPTDLAARMDAYSLNSPLTAGGGNNSINCHNKARMPSPPVQEQSFFAQNRAILLSGLPPSPRASPAESDKGVAAPSQTRRQGMRGPPSRRLTPLVTRSGSISAGRMAMQSATAYSPIRPSSPRVVSSCVHVRATNLRRPSAASSRAVSESGEGDTAMADGENGNALQDGQLYICALVRPNSDEKPYAIQRVVDREALIRSLPKPEGRMASHISILPSPIVPPRSPLPGLLSLRSASNTPLPASPALAKRMSPLSPALVSPYASARRPSRQHSRQSSLKDLSPPPPSPAQFFGDGGVPIPIHPHPAFGVLPGLAAVILSGHIRPGDTIEQPMPHPEAWQETVAYAYQAHGEVSEAVRQNIEHLGGRVE